jgi:UrcA family protein
MIRTALVAAALLAAPAAFADTAIAVPVAATDLADIAQMDVLHRDLAMAAKRVCAREMVDLPRQTYLSCVEDTLARAIAASGSETLVALDKAVPTAQRFAANRPAVVEATVATFK